MVEHGCHDATADPGTILRWWTDHPNANIGIATGAKSRLLVVDLDTYKSPDALERFQNHHGTAKTLTVKTAHGGRHLYFALGPRQKARCTTEVEGVCLKGNGGYVIAPGSIVDGLPYTILDARTPAKAPVTLCPQTASKLNKPNATARTSDTTNGRNTTTPAARESSQCSEKSHLSHSDHSEQSIEQIALVHVADSIHQNHRAIFNMVRALKAVELERGQRLSAPDKIEAFNTWFAESDARGLLRPGASRESYQNEYLNAWLTAKLPAGNAAILAALEAAKTNPLPPEADFFDDPDKKRLIACCFTMHKLADGGVWFLSGRMAAQVLFGDTDKQTTIALWFRQFRALGILAMAQQATTTKSFRYRYVQQQPITAGNIESPKSAYPIRSS